MLYFILVFGMLGKKNIWQLCRLLQSIVLELGPMFDFQKNSQKNLAKKMAFLTQTTNKRQFCRKSYHDICFGEKRPYFR
jgi:hypothetical protein